MQYLILVLSVTGFAVPGGLYSRFTYSSWDSSSHQWADEAGWNKNASGSKVFTVCSTGANGAAGKICELRGTTLSWLHLGDSALPPVFTMCSVTRYAGYWKGLILAGPSDFIHGHSRNQTTGVAYYDKWMTKRSNITTQAVDTDWLIFCGQNAAPWHFFANGQSVGTVDSGTTVAGGHDLGVNYCPSEGGWPCDKSDFGIVEIAIWNRTLSKGEILGMQGYYSDMLARGNLGPCPQFGCFQSALFNVLSVCVQNTCQCRSARLTWLCMVLSLH